MGFEEDMLAQIQKKIYKLYRNGCQRAALERALNYACSWAFVTGYKIIFDARIGLFYEDSKHLHIAIFLSFKDINNLGTAIPQDTSSTGGTSFMDSTGGQPRPENVSTSQLGGSIEPKAASSITKRWVASRILHLMLRCYGSTTFPKELWFMEEWKDDRRPFLLLPYLLGVRDSENLIRRSVKSRRLIIKAIEDSMESVNAAEEEGSMTDVG